MVETPENFCGRYGNTTHGHYDYATMKKEIIARDAAVAHEARVGVLRAAHAEAVEHFGHDGINRARAQKLIEKIAARHNITAAELEPPKVWGPEDVQIVHRRENFYSVICGDNYWEWWQDRWNRGDITGSGEVSKFKAEAIRDRIVRDGNYPVSTP